MSDLISRQAALEAMDTWDKFGCDPDGKLVRYDDDKHYVPYVHYEDMVHAIKHLPSAQPEITLESAIDYLHSIGWMQEHDRILTESARPEVILCNSCKHWTQSTGKMTGYGLGRCDFHDADLVTCNGFCYWAERRTDD